REEQDDLRDNSRTELPIVYVTPGGYELASAYRDARRRTDLLLTYLPNPGTVFYLGYGDVRSEPDDLGRRRLVRRNDAVFVKLSYPFRMPGSQASKRETEKRESGIATRFSPSRFLALITPAAPCRRVPLRPRNPRRAGPRRCLPERTSRGAIA